MKKLLMGLPLLILMTASVLALVVSTQGFWLNGGTLDYLGTETSLTASKPQMQVHLREFVKDGEATYQSRGYITFQAIKPGEKGHSYRVSINLNDLVEIYQNDDGRLYAKFSGRVIYWEKGNVPKVFYSENIRVDINKISGTANFAGLEETAYKFRVTGAEVWKSSK